MLVRSSTPVGKPIPTRPTVERPSLFDLLLSLVDARLSHVDILETAWGLELEQYLRAQHVVRRVARATVHR